MNDICVFGDYKVRRICNYSYISDKIGNEYIFSDGKADNTQQIDGGRLMDMIAKEMLEHDTIGVHFYDEENSLKISIEQFNPNTGEGSDTDYIIERSEENK